MDQDKLRELQLYFLNTYVAEKDEYFSDTEPDTSFMEQNGTVRTGFFYCVVKRP